MTGPACGTYSVVEAAQRLGISKTHLYRLLDRGEFPFPAIRISSRKWRIPSAPLDAALRGESPHPLPAEAAS